MPKSQRSSIAVIVLALVSGALLSTSTRAQDKPIGDLLIWYDETPISIGGGTMVWKGKAALPLTRDASGKIKGSGSYPASYVTMAAGCTSTCKFTTAMSVAGSAQIGGSDLMITAKSTTASCQVKCPRGAAMATSQHQEGYSEKVFLPFGATQPVKKSGPSGGPTQYYQLQQQCDAEPDQAGPIEVAIKPGAGKWTSTTLSLLTLADVRGRVPPNPQRYGYTSHDLKPAITFAGKSKPARGGGGFCYWVQSVTLSFDPIEVAIPGIDFREDQCEYKAIAKHEAKHVKLYEGLLTGLSAELQKAVQSSGLPRASAPLHVTTVEAGRQHVENKLEETAAPIRARWVDKKLSGDANIDTAAEQKAVKASCPRGWK